jgi:hypothetical protein
MIFKEGSLSGFGINRSEIRFTTLLRMLAVIPVPLTLMGFMSTRLHLVLVSLNYVIYVSAEETTSAKKLRSDATFAEVNPVWFGHRYVPVPD